MPYGYPPGWLNAKEHWNTEFDDDEDELSCSIMRRPRNMLKRKRDITADVTQPPSSHEQNIPKPIERDAPGPAKDGERSPKKMCHGDINGTATTTAPEAIAAHSTEPKPTGKGVCHGDSAGQETPAVDALRAVACALHGLASSLDRLAQLL